MAQVINIGTLVSTTIRPYYSDDIFPTVQSNDVLGGIHLIQSKSIGIGFDEIIPSRRQWGMLVFVYDEQKYYQLVPRNTGDPDVSKNINWVEYTGGSVGSLEWVDSIKGNQRQSDTIRGNERQSEAIGGNQRHQRLS